jgi:predicted PurR-regulated permease PerM
VGGYMRGVIILGGVSGLIVGTGAYALGLDYPLVFAALAFAAEFVPIVGPLVSILAALFLSFLKSPDLVPRIALFYIIYYQIDAYLLAPRVTGKILDIHPVAVLLGVLLGGKLGGIVGMFIAAPSLAVLRVLFKYIMPR